MDGSRVNRQPVLAVESFATVITHEARVVFMLPNMALKIIFNSKL